MPARTAPRAAPRTALALLCLCASTLATSAAATGQPVPGPGLSPIVTWDPELVYGGVARPATVRPMTPAELKLSRERAEVFFQALKAVPVFAQPLRHTTFMTSWAHLARGPVLSQKFVVYWGDPRDTRRRADGAYYGAMGGALELLFIDTNRVPLADKLGSEGRQDFDRRIEEGGVPVVLYAEPTVHARAGGGAVYGQWFIATRDGSPALAPVPLALLLELDIAQLKKRAADSERGFASSLRELEASMTPEAAATRRARRQAAWARETKDPDAMTRRLDAAERTDQSDYGRQKARLTPPPVPDPRSPHWSAKLALQALEQKLAALGPAGRHAPACGALDPAFEPGLNMRWHAVGADAPADCQPMVRLRADLLAPGKPEEVRVLAAWLRDAQCGKNWDRPPQDNVCSRITTTLRDMDWAAVRRSFGWKDTP
jgi:hypothetical protein